MPVLDYKTMKSRPAWNSYVEGVTKNWGKKPTPLIPHVRNRVLGKRSRPGSVSSSAMSVASNASTVKYKRGGIAQGRVMNEGTGGQYSMFTGKKGKSYLPSHVLNALPPQVYQTNGALQFKSAVGKQNLNVPLFLNRPSIVTSYTSDDISRVVMQKSSGDVTLNNIYLSNCYIIIYDIMARKDVSVTAIDDPGAAWSQGDTDTGSSSAWSFLGSTPWQSEAFNQYWKVCQVTNVVLGAGATHVHKVRLNPNRQISASYATYTPYAFKDLTYACLIEIHGSPANDTTTQTQVGIGTAGLNVVWDSEHTIKQLQKAYPIITDANNLITAFTVGEQVVNMGGSSIQAQAEG